MAGRLCGRLAGCVAGWQGGRLAGWQGGKVAGVTKENEDKTLLSYLSDCRSKHISFLQHTFTLAYR